MDTHMFNLLISSNSIIVFVSARWRNSMICQ